MKIFPAPQKIIYKDNKKFSYDKEISIGANDTENSVLRLWSSYYNIPVRTEGLIDLKLSKCDKRELTYIEDNNTVSKEKYKLDINCSYEKVVIKIEYAHDRGLLFALNTILSMIEANEFENVIIEDYPLFEIRGFIEGFYGTPWDLEQRVNMIELLSRFKMNTYFYGPKDDIYHREKWSELYDENSLKVLNTVLEATKKNLMDFYYCIAPGLTIRYSSENDFNLLMKKIHQLYGIGVRNFGMLLDDIPEELLYSEDQEKYGETVKAQIDLINRFYRELKRLDQEINLVVCPTLYHGRGNEYYISKLGQEIDAQINIFWTGEDICSKEIGVMDSVQFINGTRHKPLYWDNYPVNDAEMVHEMHMGPVLGREEELYKYSKGLVANGMEYSEASKVPYITIACYLWNPKHYNPDDCWTYGLKKIVGIKDYEIFQYFVEHLLYSCVTRSNSPKLSAVLERFSFIMKLNQKEEAMFLLKDYMNNLNAACSLVQGKMQNQMLNKELEKWIKKFVSGCELLNNCVLFLECGENRILEKIKQQYEAFQNDPTIVFAHSLNQFIDKILARQNW